jgi:hypothetical protein
MKKYTIILSTSLVASSAVLYTVQILFFNNPRDTFFYLFQDLAFVPISVLLVTLIVDRLLSAREKSTMLKKLNMVIGAFFSEVGTALLRSFSDFDRNSDKIREALIVSGGWSEMDFSSVSERIRSYDCVIDSKRGNLEELRSFLTGKRDFLLRLLENPNLLEHESFTELLWAVFHLIEELAHRVNLKQLHDKDYEHLAGDIKRADVLLISEWLDYMKHLKEDYPYLFSLAMRTNPFDPSASPEIR